MSQNKLVGMRSQLHSGADQRGCTYIHTCSCTSTMHEYHQQFYCSTFGVK